MRKIAYNAAILVLIFCFTTASTRAQSYEFVRLDNTDGLLGNQVRHIFKDSRGFLWICTNIGLDRYDGVNFKNHRHVKNDPNSPAHDMMFSIQEDISGNLWIQSYGYMLYDWKNERFINNTDSVLAAMGLPPAPTLIEFDGEKNLFLAYPNRGVYKYDVRSKSAALFRQSKSGNDLDPSDIAQLKIQDSFLWALHRNGVLERINTETKSVDFRNTFFRENAQNATINKMMFIDSDSHAWIYPGIDDKGVACLNIRQNHWTLLNTATKPALSHDFVRCMGQSNDSRIWIGTDHGGVNIFDKKQGAIEVVKNNVNDRNSISQNSIISMMCEKDGAVWIGTYKNGLSYHHPNIFKFKKSPLFYLFNRNSEILDCNRFYKDASSNLWIGTNGQGLIKYNPQSGSIQRFRNEPSNPQSLSSDIVTAIVEDHEQTLWVGTFLGGMNAFDGKKFIRYRRDENNPNSLANKSVYDIIEDESGCLWIATLGGGIDCLNPKRNQFANYNTENSSLRSNFILSATVDVHKNIYFCSDAGGMYVVNRGSQTILPYFAEASFMDSLTTASTPYSITDSRGLLWIATGKGINIYNPFTKQFSYITSSNGLPSDVVVSLIEDNAGNIWAGTHNGLVGIYCKYEKQQLEYSLVCFDEADGLTGSEFNSSAIFKDKDGIIYAGSSKGYTAFSPKEITFNRVIPRILFTDLLLANQVVQPNVKHNGRVIIDRSIACLNEVTLKHGETNFAIRFAALNFIHPKKNKYRYMLEGLDKQWTEITNGTGVASYSNLNPGTYNLVVYASNNDNVWTTEPATIKIVVKPSFWLSGWAYMVYFMLLLSLIWLFLKYMLHKQKEAHRRTQKMLEINKMHEVDELKFKFFTNISHEFKTPITLILNPLEMLIKSPVYQEYKSTMDIMHKNAHALLNMVNEILDFRKLDMNKAALSKSRGNIIEFTKDICHSFSSLAAEKGIKLTFTTYLQELQMEFDKEKMHKIVTNLISNAFKYIESGHIDISVGILEQIQSNDSLSVKQMCLKVSDTGIGIEAEYQDKIFERFFRIEHADRDNQPGTGVGLHLVSEYVKLHGGEVLLDSTVGKGSVFTVLIPAHDSTIKKLKSQETIHAKEDFLLSDEERNSRKIRKIYLPLLLVVDDNEDFCEFMTKLFVDDYQVVTAYDGEEGYNIVLDRVPNIIICDVMMPKMDGFEFCRKIKEDIRISHIPVILLTAKSSEESKYSGIEAGADDYISKPFNIDMLKLKIKKIIEKQKKLQSKFKQKVAISPSGIAIVSMDEKFIQKSIAIVEKNISNPDFLIEDLYKEMGMSRVYFYKKILALTDKTPSEFVRFIRMKRAADLLEKSQLFVNEIAYQVGFNEPKYFRKYFKEEFGVTPNEYKRAH